MTQSVVYFIQGEITKAIKIGRTYSVFRRLKTLQNDVSENLIILGIVSESDFSETLLHKRFSKENIRGEWFNPSIRLLSFIEKNSTMPAVPEAPAAPTTPTAPPQVVLPVGYRLLTVGSITNAVKGYRIKSGLTQEDLAEKSGVSRQFVCEFEKRGLRAPLGLVFRLIQALDIPIVIGQYK